MMMGAGVPTHIPGVIDDIFHGRVATLPFAVTGAASDHPASSLTFDPTPYLGTTPLQRPKFVGIVSSHVLATALFKRRTDPWTASSSNDPAREATTRRRVAPMPSTSMVPPSTVPVTKSTSTSCAVSACPSGSAAVSPHPLTSPTPSLSAPPVCKWARCSPTATNPAWNPNCATASSRTSRVTPWWCRPRPPRRRPVTPSKWSTRSVPSATPTLRRENAKVRPGVPARGVPRRERSHRVPLCGRATYYLRVARAATSTTRNPPRACVTGSWPRADWPRCDPTATSSQRW